MESKKVPELNVLWKIARVDEIEEWRRTGLFTFASDLDKQDKFFHLSNGLRIKTTAGLYFKNSTQDVKMVKITPKRVAEKSKRAIIFCDEEPSKDEIESGGDTLFIHYLLVGGVEGPTACCAHLFYNEKFPIKSEDIFDFGEVFEMPWNEDAALHSFPGIDSVE